MLSVAIIVSFARYFVLPVEFRQPFDDELCLSTTFISCDNKWAVLIILHVSIVDDLLFLQLTVRIYYQSGFSWINSSIITDARFLNHKF